MTLETLNTTSSADLVRSSAWFVTLSSALQEQVLRSCSDKQLQAGDELIRMGDEPMHWVGVREGLLQMWITSDKGQETTLAVIGEGEWCAEGSLIKAERYRYNAVALTATKVVLIPAHAFEAMRQESIAFNHALQTTMNARMACFIDLLLAGRMLDVDARVEQCLRLLAAKQPRQRHICISQQHFALLCGLSRQRVNLALRHLQDAGKIERGDGGIRLLALTD